MSPLARLKGWLPQLFTTLILPGLMLLCALVLLASWVSHLFAPRPVAALPNTGSIATSITPDQALRIFGVGSAQKTQITGIELTGIYAPAQGRGFATFRLPQASKFAFVGDEIQPGMRVMRIQQDHVVYWLDGQEHRLELPVVKSATLMAPEATPTRP